MNLKQIDRSVLEAGNPEQTGTNMDGDVIVAKRKYVPPRCHAINLTVTDAKFSPLTTETTVTGS